MHSQSRPFLGALTLFVASLVVTPGPASAIRLDALEGHTQTIGNITFTFTKVEETGGVDLSSLDLSLAAAGPGNAGLYVVLAPDAAAPVEANASSPVLDIKLEFTVESTAALLTLSNALTGSSVSGNGTVSISELVEPGGGADLLVFQTAFAENLLATAPLGGVTSIDVTKNIVLTGSASGHGRIDSFEQIYSMSTEPVPEPSTGLLVLLGLSGIAHARKRTKKRSISAV